MTQNLWLLRLLVCAILKRKKVFSLLWISKNVYYHPKSSSTFWNGLKQKIKNFISLRFKKSMIMTTAECSPSPFRFTFSKSVPMAIALPLLCCTAEIEISVGLFVVLFLFKNRDRWVLPTSSLWRVVASCWKISRIFWERTILLITFPLMMKLNISKHLHSWIPLPYVYRWLLLGTISLRVCGR